MDISLSIESFPLDRETATDMTTLLKNYPADYSVVLQADSWCDPLARGFAVLAYSEGEELLAFAIAIDVVGLHHYEWSMIVTEEFRRQSIGSALADGIHHGLRQRNAEAVTAAFLEDGNAGAFLSSLNYSPSFKEMQYRALPLEHFHMPEGIEIEPYNGEREELKGLLVSAFDQTAVPVMEFNIAEPGRAVFLMKKDHEVLATVAIVEEPETFWITSFTVRENEQGNGYGQTFLEWCRHFAFTKNKGEILLDMDTDNDAVSVYQKAGFEVISTVEYWEQG
ncbi:MAG TPA: GNAT family N-acetyltransferase [Planococcus sp. (in: firmicutes)]|nr:GNAT family N-acetyltransferase [Planococcus sp. (in: firmicutes)]